MKVNSIELEAPLFASLNISPIDEKIEDEQFLDVNC